jgi:DNA-directed RNA polymerase specialized sigma24 family protein
LNARSDEVSAWIRPDVAFELEELESFIDRAIDALPLVCRQVYLMVREDDVSTRAAASALRISPTAVREHLLNTQRRLRAALANFRDECGIHRLPTTAEMTRASTEVSVPKGEVFQRSGFSAA